ncbi:MAG: rRNA maturation RNase YbeY [Verrucomicrobia bacterium GWF2_51_19]|nr:MAG: rRNA maturation RNase YbeY [Verrucomicrobia bacterium GWF2_51_19]HCJ12304.1 rRNA maturation RNase YbeY [Opitutae bacterium]
MIRPVEVFNAVKGFSCKKNNVRALFRLLDTFDIQITAGELSIAFLPDVELAQIHATYLDDPSPTDVITFYVNDPDFAGEILVSPERASIVAPENDNTLEQELTLYLIHGWLHLAGYNDINPAERKAMRLAEQQTLAFLRQKGYLLEVHF